MVMENRNFKSDSDKLESLKEEGKLSLQEASKMVSYSKDMEGSIGGLIISMNRFYAEFGFSVPSSIRAFTSRADLVKGIWDRVDGRVNVDDWRQIHDKEECRSGVITN